MSVNIAVSIPGQKTKSEGQAVRVVPCLLLMILLICGGTGCALFGGKSADGGGKRWLFPSSGEQQEKPPPAPRDPLFDSHAANPAEVKGVLAGQVLDGRTGQPTSAHIRYVCLDDPQPVEAPVDVATHSDGTFNIYGLEYGKHYKLIARTKNGNKAMAGSAYATAPQIAVVIRVKEDFVTDQTPPVPQTPSYPRPQKKKSGDPLSGEAAHDTGDANNQSSVKIRGFGIGKPFNLDDPPETGNRQNDLPNDPPTHAPPKSYPPNIIRTPPMTEEKKLPVPEYHQKPSSLPAPPPYQEPPSDTGTIKIGLNTGAQIPSCAVVGKQVINFALHDFYGQPWEWKKDRRGKLVLLDFWRTDCAPCLQDMSHLRVLQEKYSGDGLEILGIASERNGSLEDQKYKVIQVCNWKQTKHRMLLNSGSFQQTFLERFNVQEFPTLILLDENGNELWRHTGQLTSSARDALEHHIRWKLGGR